ncbi:MAG: hypothetical protein WCJ41_19740 [Aestuariivirga sp.]|uniref:hypothetical protein n=1 Tax=Aestuariivirga sp. TaxID=2650926 RepID=UPI00301663DC
MTASIGALKARIEGLEESHAFPAMYFTQRVAERLHELRLAAEKEGDEVTANAMFLAYKEVREMAQEFHEKSPVGLGDIT